MDSGNSGSLQSSSGGDDDEYDSRSDPISAFFHSSSSAAAALTNLPPPQQPPPLFDSLSYLDSSPNPLLNLDALWSRTLLRPPSSCSTNPNNFTDVDARPPVIPTTSSAPPPPLGPQQQQEQAPSAATRGSKKRSRASRQAPTTVLTTDTSNFRAMVQEFTGIPTAPAGFSRPRFNPPSSYYNLLRPFPQRIFTTTTNAMNTSISANIVQQNQNPNFESLLPPKPTLPIMPPFPATSQAHTNNNDLRWAEGFAIRDQSQTSRPLSTSGFPTSVFQGKRFRRARPQEGKVRWILIGALIQRMDKKKKKEIRLIFASATDKYI